MLETPEEYRREAEAMERLADLLSYKRDKERLKKKASEYRVRAAALDARPKWGPTPHP